MHRTSDWFLFPEALGPVRGQTGGLWTYKKLRYVHRSLLSSLPPEQRAGVGNPLRAEEIAAVEEGNLRPYQIDVAKFCRERDGTIVAMSMGCVAGETIVRLNRGGAGRPYRVDVLWQRLHEPDRDRSHLWDRQIPTMARALCDGELRLHRMLDVVAKGRRPVLRLTLASGKSLRLTGDHEVGLSGDLWVPAKDLEPGVRVLSNGAAVCEICGGSERVVTSTGSRFRGYCWSCARRYVMQPEEQPSYRTGRTVDQDGYVRVTAGVLNHHRRTTGGVYEHILVMERHLGRRVLRHEQVHHRNGNRGDNRIENLELVTSAEHHVRHRSHRHLEGSITGKGGLVQFVPIEDEVVSIEPDGEADVFDLVMDDPHRNFVANGIVVHNCGKTRTSLFASKVDGDVRGLVIAPKVTFDVWKKEIALVYGTGFPVHVLRGQKPSADPAALRRPGIYLINPELLPFRWMEWLNGPRLDFTILDEAHLYTRGRAQRSRAAGALANLSKQRIALTGTPILRHVMDLHGIIETVSPGALGSWAYMALWLGFRRGSHGWNLGPVEPAARDRLEHRLAEMMASVRWEDVSDEVPPLQRELLPLDLDPADRAEYDRLAADVREVFGTEIGFEDLSSAAAAGLTQLSALRRYVGEKKIDHAVDLAQTAGEPVVVWCWHRATAQETAKRLRSAGFAVSLVTGEDKDTKRREQIAKFQNGETDVFVGTIATGGLGIDLTRARITVMGELSWLPAEIAQAEARVFRSGQTRPCITYWPIFNDTIEKRIIEVLISKADHARADIFPGMAVKVVAYDPAAEMISLLEHAMEEEDE